MPASRSAPANSSGGRPAAGTWPGARRAAPFIAMFQIPNKFFEKDGRVVDASGKDWDPAWGALITEIV